MTTNQLEWKVLYSDNDARVIESLKYVGYEVTIHSWDGGQTWSLDVWGKNAAAKSYARKYAFAQLRKIIAADIKRLSAALDGLK